MAASGRVWVPTMAKGSPHSCLPIPGWQRAALERAERKFLRPDALQGRRSPHAAYMPESKRGKFRGNFNPYRSAKAL